RLAIDFFRLGGGREADEYCRHQGPGNLHVFPKHSAPWRGRSRSTGTRRWAQCSNGIPVIPDRIRSLYLELFDWFATLRPEWANYPASTEYGRKPIVSPFAISVTSSPSSPSRSVEVNEEMTPAPSCGCLCAS